MWDLKSMFYQNMPVDTQRAQDMKRINIIVIHNFQSLMSEFRLVDLYSFTKYIVAFKMWSTCCTH